MSGLRIDMSLNDMPDVQFAIRRETAAAIREEASRARAVSLDPLGRLVEAALLRVAATVETGVRASGAVEKG